ARSASGATQPLGSTRLEHVARAGRPLGAARGGRGRCVWALKAEPARTTAMPRPVYRRVVVKVSGEALMGPDGFGIHQPTLEQIAADLVATHKLGVAMGGVVGGGNIFRGRNGSETGLPR